MGPEVRDRFRGALVVFVEHAVESARLHYDRAVRAGTLSLAPLSDTTTTAELDRADLRTMPLTDDFLFRTSLLEEVEDKESESGTRQAFRLLRGLRVYFSAALALVDVFTQTEDANVYELDPQQVSKGDFFFPPAATQSPPREGGPGATSAAGTHRRFFMPVTHELWLLVTEGEAAAAREQCTPSTLYSEMRARMLCAFFYLNRLKVETSLATRDPATNQSGHDFLKWSYPLVQSALSKTTVHNVLAVYDSTVPSGYLGRPTPAAQVTVEGALILSSASVTTLAPVAREAVSVVDLEESVEGSSADQAVPVRQGQLLMRARTVCPQGYAYNVLCWGQQCLAPDPIFEKYATTFDALEMRRVTFSRLTAVGKEYRLLLQQGGIVVGIDLEGQEDSSSGGRAPATRRLPQHEDQQIKDKAAAASKEQLLPPSRGPLPLAEVYFSSRSSGTMQSTKRAGVPSAAFSTPIEVWTYRNFHWNFDLEKLAPQIGKSTPAAPRVRCAFFRGRACEDPLLADRWPDVQTLLEFTNRGNSHQMDRYGLIALSDWDKNPPGHVEMTWRSLESVYLRNVRNTTLPDIYDRERNSSSRRKMDATAREVLVQSQRLHEDTTPTAAESGGVSLSAATGPVFGSASSGYGTQMRPGIAPGRARNKRPIPRTEQNKSEGQRGSSTKQGATTGSSVHLVVSGRDDDESADHVEPDESSLVAASNRLAYHPQIVIDEEYFQVRTVLRALQDWLDSGEWRLRPFAYLEWGALQGPWSVRVAKWIDYFVRREREREDVDQEGRQDQEPRDSRAGGVAPCRLLLVEPTGHGVASSLENLALNDVRCESALVWQGYISAGSSGTGSERTEDEKEKASAVTNSTEAAPTAPPQRGWESWREAHEVPDDVVMMRDVEVIDLVDMDIQGQELYVIPRFLDEFADRVRRIHVGTHEKFVHKRLRAAFESHKYMARTYSQSWVFEQDYLGMSARGIEHYGNVLFRDGVMTLRNPRL
ncbi:unnamed protein product [Amoebophrya sp. A120]|nr:unnamed protein product [Amoebophrya sp. A120]|eukprot:GSA120T00022186001.1